MGSDSEGNVVKLEGKSDEDEKRIGSLFKVRKSSRVSHRRKTNQVSEIRAEIEENPNEEEKTGSEDINDTLAVIKKKLKRPKIVKNPDLTGSKQELICEELEKKEVSTDLGSVKSNNKRARFDLKSEEEEKKDEKLDGSDDLGLEDSLFVLFKKSRKVKNSTKIVVKLEEETETETAIKLDDTDLNIEEKIVGLISCSNEVVGLSAEEINDLSKKGVSEIDLVSEIKGKEKVCCTDRNNDLSKEGVSVSNIISEINDKEKLCFSDSNNKNKYLFREGVPEAIIISKINETEKVDCIYGNNNYNLSKKAVSDENIFCEINKEKDDNLSKKAVSGENIFCEMNKETVYCTDINNDNLSKQGVIISEINEEKIDCSDPLDKNTVIVNNNEIINNNDNDNEMKPLGSPDSTRAEADDLSPAHHDIIATTEKEEKIERENREKVLRVRNAKKRRHDDMAYEGDADWENLNNEQNLFNVKLKENNYENNFGNNYENKQEEVLNGRVAAVRAGLKAMSVLPIEKIRFRDLLKRKGGLHEYLELRNMILSRWSKDVKQILPLSCCGVSESICENESPREALIREIYLFLDQNGYINSGIATKEPNSQQNNSLQTDRIKPESSPLNPKKILIIGAGPSGLAAARHLSRQGFSCTVLEARDRIGGRVHTDKDSLSVPVDLGASIITGVEADLATERQPDPSSLICSQLGLDLTVLNSDCPLYDLVSGELVPPDLDQALESEYNTLLDEMVLLVAQEGENANNLSLEYGLELGLRKHREGILEEDVLSPIERRVMNWHFAHLEYGCATMLKEVSLPHWNQDDVYGGFGGAHCMIKGGFGNVVESLAHGLDVRLNHVVTDIMYHDNNNDGNDGNNKVKVKVLDGGEFEGDAVLVTIPLGCLKANSVKFSPELPNWKQESIKRLGFGVLNKVVLEFPTVFWDENVDYFGATAEDSDSRGKCFMFWNLKKTVNAPVLIALIAGKSAIEGEKIEHGEHVNHAVKVLRKIFGEETVPNPIGSVVTNWGSEPFTRGSYSYVSVGATGDDYDILGKPVANRLFFAGEATCKEHPDTVGGAMLSGMREAVRMISVLTDGRDFVAEIEAAETGFRKTDVGRNEVREFGRRMEGLGFAKRPGMLREMFFAARTTGGRLFLVKEMLRAVKEEEVKGFAGSKDGLATLNSWILDSLGKNATQLLRHCVRLLVLVSTDLVAVRLSGIGRTVKEKVCMHTSRDIRAIASQLVKVWIEVFRREKASKKAFIQNPKPSKKSEFKTPITIVKSSTENTRSDASSCNSDRTESDREPGPSEEEAAALAAAEAARAAAIAAAQAYASQEAENAALELPKIPSFHKFAHQIQTDPKKKLSEIQLHSANLINPPPNPQLEIPDSNSTDDFNFDSSTEIRFSKAWVDVEATGVDGVKDASAIERWQDQAFEADKEFYSKLRISLPPEQDKEVAPAVQRQKAAGGSAASQRNSEGRALERVKQGVLDFVASLIMPLYKTRKLDREGYKSIMKKAVTKVLEQSTEAEKAMSVLEFLDSKRKNKIRALVDRLIERQLQVKPS
ncbi:hypothetical protein LUZ60_014641 [Juncus effusus]|nr:hypothetical protein LUZ60_014641 [Juncus effusus]